MIGKISSSIVLALLLAFTAKNSFAQNESEFHAPKFENVALGESGSSMYLPRTDSLLVEMSLSEDGSKIFTTEVFEGDFAYGIILVQFSGFTIDTKEDREGTLTAYMDYLQEAFSIVGSTGYGMGHQLTRDPSAEGIIDFWQDNEGTEWSVQGWVRPDALAVLFIYGPTTYPNYSLSKFFFNGLTF